MTTERDIRNQIAFAKDKGKIEKQLETARAMLDDNMDPKLISKYTGLSEEQIAALK